MITLGEANKRAHAILDDAYLDMLTSLFCGDATNARRQLTHFCELLASHMAVEDEKIIPRYAALAPFDDDPHAVAKIEGDHTILKKTLAVVVELLDASATDANFARTCAKRIDVLGRVRGVLEHHASREERDMYPRIEPHLDDVTRAKLAEEISAIEDIARAFSHSTAAS